MKKIVFLCGISGVGKITIYEYIKNNNLLKDYYCIDIDELENINNYTHETYLLFYENAIKKAIKNSNDKNIFMVSCINPTDIKKINIPSQITSIDMLLLTCTKEQIIKRLKKEILKEIIVH